MQLVLHSMLRGLHWTAFLLLSKAHTHTHTHTHTKINTHWGLELSHISLYSFPRLSHTHTHTFLSKLCFHCRRVEQHGSWTVSHDNNAFHMRVSAVREKREWCGGGSRRGFHSPEPARSCTLAHVRARSYTYVHASPKSKRCWRLQTI